MRSLLGRFHRPFARGVDEQLLLLNNLGDGSTLSLDFTTGVLDPRLTFTRSTNATFINSQGLVQWADSNIFYNSSWTDANNTPAAWSAGTGTASRSGETRTFTTSASQVTINQTRNTASGIRYTASVEVTAVTGSQRVDDVIVGLGGSAYQYYFNGSAVAGTTTLTPGVVSVAFTAGGATTTVRVGSGVQGTNTTGAVTLRYPQFEPGTVPLRTYRQNDSTTASYEAPRFDYDPSTLQPRGLLIEGSANNLLCLSESFATSGGTTNWAYNGNSGAVTSEVNPAGVASSFQFRETATGGGLLHQPVTPASPVGGQTYTFSIWMRGSVYSSVTTTQAQIGIQVGGTFQTVTPRIVGGYAASISGTTICTVSGLSTTQWTRVEIATTANIAASTTVNVFVWPNTTSYENNASVLLWGAQFEAGSGASSYIPTGASTGSRAADVCYITNADYGFTTTGGTYFVEWERGEFATVSGQACNPFSTDYASGRWLGIGTAPAGTTATAGSWSGFLNATGAAVAGRNRAAVSYSSWVASASGVFRANGGSEIAGTLTLGTTPTYLMIGSASASAPYNGVGLRDFVNSRIRRIKYWPSVLPSTTLQAITVNT